MVREACLQVEPEQHMSIDEQMFQGEEFITSVSPKETKEVGFKVMTQCGANVFIYDFHLYDGKGPSCLWVPA